jgi:hypothetical protein
MRFWIFNLAMLIMIGLSPCPIALGSSTPQNHSLGPSEDFTNDDSADSDTHKDEEKSPAEESPNNHCGGDESFPTTLSFLSDKKTSDSPGNINPFQMGPLNKHTEVRISSDNHLTLYDVFYLDGKAHHCSMPRKVSEEEALQLLNEKLMSDSKTTLAQAQALRDVAQKLLEETKDETTKKSLKQIGAKYESLVASKEVANETKPLPEAEQSRYRAGGKVAPSPNENGYSLKTPSALDTFRGSFSELPPGISSDTLMHSRVLPGTQSHSVQPTFKAEPVKMTFDNLGFFKGSSDKPTVTPAPTDFYKSDSPVNLPPPQPEPKVTEPETKAPVSEAKPIAKDTPPASPKAEPSSSPSKTPSAPLAPESKETSNPPAVSPKASSTPRALSASAGETQEVVFEKGKSHSDLAGVSYPDTSKQKSLTNSALQSDQEIPFGLKGPGSSVNGGFEDFKLSKSQTSRDLAGIGETSSTVFPENELKKVSAQKEASSSFTNTFSYRKKPSSKQSGSEATTMAEKTNGNEVAYSARNPDAAPGNSKIVSTGGLTNSTQGNSKFSDNFETKNSSSKDNLEKQRQGVKTATFWSPYSAESELPDGTGNLGEVEKALAEAATETLKSPSTLDKETSDPATIASNIQKVLDSKEEGPNTLKTTFELNALAPSSNDVATFSDEILGENQERSPASASKGLSPNQKQLKTVTSQAAIAEKSLWQRFLSFFRK